MDWNVEKGQQVKHLLSSSHYEKFIAFLEQKMSQIDTENNKNPKFSNIKDFMKFFSTFSTDFVGWNVEKGQQGKLCCPVGSSEAVFSFLSENVSNWHRKTSQTFPISKDFMQFFPKTFDGLCGLEHWQSQQGKNVLSSMLFRRVNCSFFSENVSN